MFALDGITANYGSLTALANISLAIDTGARVGVFGHNGAGKTTLLRCMIGAHVPAAGTVRWNGAPVASGDVAGNVRRGLAFVPQGHNVFPNLSVEQNLTIAGLLFDQSFIKEVYRLFPVLQERGGQRAGSLSGGEQQMLALGMALMTQPKWLFLDEPCTGLAPVIIGNVMRRLVDVNTRMKTGLVIVEQNVPATLGIVERAVILKSGRVVFDGFAKDLASKKELWEWF